MFPQASAVKDFALPGAVVFRRRIDGVFFAVLADCPASYRFPCPVSAVKGVACGMFARSYEYLWLIKANELLFFQLVTVLLKGIGRSSLILQFVPVH